MTAEYPDSLKMLLEDYRKGPYTPQLETDFWQEFIEHAIKQSSVRGVKVNVPKCDRPRSELKILHSQEGGMAYDPNFSLEILLKIFPKLGTYPGLAKMHLKGGYDMPGWAVIETCLKSPNRGKCEEAIREKFAAEGKMGQCLSIYTWASHASKTIYDHYFDETSFTRLLGTLCTDPDSEREVALLVSFGLKGELLFSASPIPAAGDPFVGYRSECRKLAA